MKTATGHLLNQGSVSINTEMPPEDRFQTSGKLGHYWSECGHVLRRQGLLSRGNIGLNVEMSFEDMKVVNIDQHCAYYISKLW